MRKSAWISLPRIYETIGYEKALKELSDMGLNEVYPIVSEGGGPLFPSKARPQTERYKGKDLVSDFVKEAKKHDIKVHAWIVSMNFPNKTFMEQHPDWYVINKNGESCIDNPPYINHYRWLCPSREETKENLKDLFLEVAEKFDIDGLHFDYIRLPDIILPSGLRSRYPGVPKEDIILPKYDFCYCENCRRLFKEEYGVDPINLKYFEPMYGKWYRWRAEKIKNIVKYVYKNVKSYDSSIEVSAAVFATPKLAYEYVFQDWTEWGIDLYNPMIYHKYYSQPTEWIGTATREAVLKGVNVSSGILIGFMKDENDTYKGFSSALKNGAVGITVFVYPPPKEEMKEWVKKSFKKLEEVF